LARREAKHLQAACCWRHAAGGLFRAAGGGQQAVDDISSAVDDISSTARKGGRNLSFISRLRVCMKSTCPQEGSAVACLLRGAVLALDVVVLVVVLVPASSLFLSAKGRRTRCDRIFDRNMNSV
jgi:hypothetical protein